MQDLALVKLGGSVVTFKGKPLSANVNALEGISAELAKLRCPVIVVHGGGSFGHYWSVKYDMHTSPKPYNPAGVSIVHDSMMQLNQIVTSTFLRGGLKPYSLQPGVFSSGNRGILSRIKEILTIAKNLIPVTFGDIVHVEGAKYSILSGDAIMTMLAKVLRPRRVVFATNVDGVMTDERSGEIVKVIRVGSKTKLDFSKPAGADVTGGMQRKIKEASAIASLGIDVQIINGLMPERLVDAVEGRLKLGTTITRRTK